jgi:transposase
MGWIALAVTFLVSRLKHVPGRKTDVHDCPWFQQLHTFGLLEGSFRPADRICVLRSYMRQRDMLVKSAGRHVQHMQKALTLMNIKLQQVLTDITGLTGMRIIDAILKGQRDPKKPRSNQPKFDLRKVGEDRLQHAQVRQGLRRSRR